MISYHAYETSQEEQIDRLASHQDLASIQTFRKVYVWVSKECGKERGPWRSDECIL